MAVFDGLNNVQDKFVLVENTGKTAAYVRTIIAIEVGSVTDDVIGISTGDFWKWTNHGFAEIDGNNYEIHEAVYTGSDTRHIGGILPAGEYTYNSLGQIYLSNTVTNEVCENLDGNKNGTFDVLVVSQAVQVAGFDDAATALDASFGKITTTTHPWVKTVNTNAGNDTAFEDAVKDENSDLIIIGLTDDVTYDVAAWANDAMGGAATKNIIINGNGHTITFNQTNTDWNNIVTNGAKLTINNAKITNSGNNDGPWNRHDLNFACDVELNNVVSDKAFAFKANATLNNVTINDANTSDTYAIWIQPKGQTVTLNNVTIDMLACTDGRGIKIDNQYIGSDAKKVTLNVSNTTFKTEEKSAILVNSPAGADVTISNIDISGVAADSVNAVWVDDASSAYADLVVVTGASKIVEP